MSLIPLIVDSFQYGRSFYPLHCGFASLRGGFFVAVGGDGHLCTPMRRARRISSAAEPHPPEAYCIVPERSGGCTDSGRPTTATALYSAASLLLLCLS